MTEPEPAVEVFDLAVREDEPPAAAITLFGTADPRIALERMSELAKALMDVVADRKLAVKIAGREHLTAEAWTTLGGMLGVVPVVVWTHPNETNDGFVARVEARTLDGRVVGAAESECSRAESAWAKRDPYALRSMAQTRAIGRALRAPLGQIVVLAGYEPAGAEELPNRDRDAKPADSAQPVEASAAQLEEITVLIRTLEGIDAEQDWPAVARGIAGGSSGAPLAAGRAADVIKRLRERLEALT